MRTRREKSEAIRFLEKLRGGPLTLGGLLASIRLGDELSQTEFAQKLGISKSNLCDIEKGRKLVSPERAARWGALLGYSDRQFVRLALQDLVRKSGLELEVSIGPSARRARAA